MSSDEKGLEILGRLRNDYFKKCLFLK